MAVSYIKGSFRALEYAYSMRMLTFFIISVYFFLFFFLVDSPFPFLLFDAVALLWIKTKLIHEIYPFSDDFHPIWEQHAYAVNCCRVFSFDFFFVWQHRQNIIPLRFYFLLCCWFFVSFHFACVCFAFFKQLPFAFSISFIFFFCFFFLQRLDALWFQRLFIYILCGECEWNTVSNLSDKKKTKCKEKKVKVQQQQIKHIFLKVVKICECVPTCIPYVMQFSFVILWI